MFATDMPLVQHALKVCTKSSSTSQICHDGSHVAPWYPGISQSVPDLPVCCQCVASVDCARSTVEIFEAVPMPTAKVRFSLVLCARGNECWGLWRYQVVSAACPTISFGLFWKRHRRINKGSAYIYIYLNIIWYDLHVIMYLARGCPHKRTIWSADSHCA